MSERILPHGPFDTVVPLRLTMLPDELRFNLLKLLQANPRMSQRDVAQKLGISLGTANSCLRFLARKGWIKAAVFKNGKNRSAYMYPLTPRGIREKTRVSASFLRRKTREYELLGTEVEKLRREARRRDDQ